MNGSKHAVSLIHICGGSFKKACPFCSHSDKEGILDKEIRSKNLKPTHKLLLPLTGLQDCCSPIGRPNMGP